MIDIIYEFMKIFSSTYLSIISSIFIGVYWKVSFAYCDEIINDDFSSRLIIIRDVYLVFKMIRSTAPFIVV